jgi:hypothetical protein
MLSPKINHSIAEIVVPAVWILVQAEDSAVPQPVKKN